MTQEKAPYFINPIDAPRLTQMPGLETTILTGLHGEKMMMVLNTTLPGHTVPMHSHPHEQIGMVYAGKAVLRIGGEERVVEKGDFYCIPANVPHSDTCISDEPFVMLDIFYPVREDFIKKVRTQASGIERVPLIREATIDDAASIGRVRIDTWRDAYARIIPSDYLTNLSYAEDAQRLRERLKNAEPGCFLLVAEIQGEVVGFSTGGPERSGDREYKGEIYALYVLPTYQRRGIGRKLVGASARRLLQASIGNLLVWVFSANPARQFYERLGGQLVREREIEIGGVLLPQVGYGWPDLEALASID